MSLQHMSSELQESIISDLSYDDIINYCESYPGFRYICSDQDFWKRKLKREFTALTQDGVILDPILYVTNYTLSDEDWKLTYKRWEFIAYADFSDISGTNPIYDLSHNTDIIMWYLDQNEYIPEFNLYAIAIRYNNLTILHKLHAMGFKLVSKVRVMSIGNENLKLLHSIDMDQNDVLSLSNFGILLSITAHYAQMPTVQWLYTQYPEHLAFMTNAAYNGRIDIMEWLLDQNDNDNDNDTMDQTIIMAALRGNQTTVLQWMFDREIYPDLNTVNASIELCNTNILGWLLDHELYPDLNTINTRIWICKTGSLAILQTLNEYGLQPNVEVANNAALNNRIDVLDWLETLGIYPNIHDINASRIFKITPLTKQWLRERGIIIPERYNTVSNTTSGINININPLLSTSNRASPFIRSATSITSNMKPSEQLIEPSYEIFKPDDPNYVLNPLTQHWIIRGDTLYNKLVERGIIIIK